MKKYIFANWKMQLTAEESMAIAKELATREPNENLTIGVLPSPVALAQVAWALKGSSIAVGGQNCFWEPKGAFTGEVSPLQLVEAGATYVLLGHSERRVHMGETNEMINKKIKAALNAAITPIFCVGESAEEHDAGTWKTVVKKQLIEGLAGIELTEQQDIIITYEPVWTISTFDAKPCTPEDAAEAHAFIRSVLQKHFGGESALRNFPVMYGGSVDAKNVGTYFATEGIDGVLVGGASQKLDSFTALIESASK